ncbi:short-chain dehydrogenase/reductase SDR [Zopfochytrium polystomum]|nr:short-chain dehydrogenase/reductase SDR [Zopfochytrium polystomum]
MSASSSSSDLSLKGKNVFISGASRGIGLAIALKLASQGANIAIAAKTAEPHPKLPGTIYTAADEIRKAGGRALPIICDIRFEDQVVAAIEKTVAEFGGLDILVNNASAISLTKTEDTPVKKYDLMNQVNGRGTWMCSKYAIPHLKKSAKAGRNPHILTLSPPLDLNPAWFESHVAYSMQKYAMSLATLGLAEELRPYGIAANALWPQTAIATAAISGEIAPEAEDLKMRTTAIMADAAFVILSQDARLYTRQFVMDEAILRHQGVTDFTKYRTDPNCSEEDLMPDFFVPERASDHMAKPPRQVLAKL